MKKMTQAQLLAALSAIVDAIREDDSAEGSLHYAWSDEPGMYDVEASIRVGNREGQGGVMLL